jgi:hypothetical protein
MRVFPVILPDASSNFLEGTWPFGVIAGPWPARQPSP